MDEIHPRTAHLGVRFIIYYNVETEDETIIKMHACTLHRTRNFLEFPTRKCLSLLLRIIHPRNVLQTEHPTKRNWRAIQQKMHVLM